MPRLLHDVSVGAGPIIITLVCTVLVPLLLGLQLRVRLPRHADRLQFYMQKLSTVSSNGASAGKSAAPTRVQPSMSNSGNGDADPARRAQT